jgi:methyltransferase (TIGR00027 family)
MVVVTVEQTLPSEQRVVTDGLAARFLPFPVPAFLTLARFAPLRNWIVRMSNRRGYGVWAGVLCRKRYIDDQISLALRSGVESVVILGAGLDTHAYRDSFPRDIPVFELDLPENSEYKRKKIRRLFGEIPAHVHLTAVNFNRQDPAGLLAAEGYRSGSRSLFLWEAVTQYLSEAGARKAMNFLATAGRGSRLVFTYIREDFLNGSNTAGLEIMHEIYCGDPPVWRFGLAPGKVGDFLGQYGWKEVEQLGAREFTDRFLAPVGRSIPVTDLERSVLAEKV